MRPPGGSMGSWLLAALRDRKNLLIAGLAGLLVLCVVWPPRLNRYQILNGRSGTLYRVDRLTDEVYWIVGNESRKVQGLGEEGKQPWVDYQPDAARGEQ